LEFSLVIVPVPLVVQNNPLAFTALPEKITALSP